MRSKKSISVLMTRKDMKRSGQMLLLIGMPTDIVFQRRPNGNLPPEVAINLKVISFPEATT